MNLESSISRMCVAVCVAESDAACVLQRVLQRMLQCVLQRLYELWGMSMDTNVSCRVD